MKQILQVILICIFCLPAATVTTSAAQKDAPKWMKKAQKAVFTLTTYGKDGNKLGSTTGFFTSETGEALSSYNIFEGAAKATVTNSEGKTFAVKKIQGADELYDAVKFQVDIPKKTEFLPLATAPVANGTTVYLLPFSSGKKANFLAGNLTEVSNLKGAYKYYKAAIPFDEQSLNAPLLTPEGEVFALVQADAGGDKNVCYGLSAAYANSLSIGSADYLSAVYRNIGIPKGWPTDPEQASVALYLVSGSQDVKTRLATINDFIATFPELADGYLTRSDLYAYNRATLANNPAEQTEYLEKALDDIRTAAQYAEHKGDEWYNTAKLIYGLSSSDTTLTDPAWNVDAAMEAINKAIEAEDYAAYHQLKADMLFSQKDYQQAFDEYMVVNNSDLASATSYYLAAKAKEQITGFNIGDVIALLDKAIEKCGTNMNAEAAAYVLERVNWRLRLAQYAEAIADYDLYYKLVNGQVAPDFYYLREQAKFRANDLDGALADIRSAIAASPQTPDYYAEEASVLVRQQKHEEALKSLDQALTLAPDFGACYRLRGVCYVRLGKKAEACEAFNKAKELGDPLAERLIKEHCQ